jgi:hypothetical protein
MNRQQWAGIPWEKRYSQSISAPSHLVKEMRKIDDLLDLKFYMPTECWHVVRYLGSRGGRFTRCWECNDSPGKHRELGSWIIEALHKGDTWNRPILEDIDKDNKELKESIDRTNQHNAEEVAKELAPLYKNWEENGPNSDYHLNYAVSSPKEDQQDGFIVRDHRKCTLTN